MNFIKLYRKFSAVYFKIGTLVNAENADFFLLFLYRTNVKVEPQSSQRKALKLGVLPGTARQGKCSALRGKNG